MRSRDVTLLVLVSLLRGGSYLPVVLAAEALAAGTIVLVQVAIAAAALLAFGAWRRPAELRATLADLRARPGTALLAGGLFIAAPLALIALAVQTVPTGLAAILIATAPIWSALLALRLDARQAPSALQSAGLAIGLVGVVVAIGPDGLDGGALPGVLALLAAAASYAAAGLVIKRRYAGPPTAYTVTTTTTLAALPLLVLLAGVTELRGGLTPVQVPDAGVLAALAVLGLACTALALVAYLRLVGNVGAGRAVLVTYLSPVAALALGALALGEPVGPRVLGGFALVVGGVVLASGSVRVRGGRRAGHRRAAAARARDRHGQPRAVADAG